jgi:hypothetical protein
VAAKGEQVSNYFDELEKKHKHPEWYPLPPGVVTAAMFGMVALFYVVYAFANDEWGWGIVSLTLGALAIHEVGSAAYTAGLRREGRAQDLRRRNNEAILRESRPGLSEGREGVPSEGEEEAQD